MNDHTTVSANVLLLDGSQPGDRELLGGKAYSVNRMHGLGLPVPLAFALPTDMCGVYHRNDRALPEPVWQEIREAVTALEADTGRTFGAGPSPLLVSVRSGAAQSMPGMMDTVLNLGLTPDLVAALATESGDEAWARDTWNRFRRSYADIVLGEPGGEPPADPWEQRGLRLLDQRARAFLPRAAPARRRRRHRRHGAGDGLRQSG